MVGPVSSAISHEQFHPLYHGSPEELEYVEPDIGMNSSGFVKNPAVFVTTSLKEARGYAGPEGFVHEVVPDDSDERHGEGFDIDRNVRGNASTLEDAVRKRADPMHVGSFAFAFPGRMRTVRVVKD